MVQEIKKVFDAIHKLNYILSKEQKIYCVIVFILSLISAILELLGVSIVIPLMSAILSIDELKANTYASAVFSFFHLESDFQIIIFICCGVAVIYIAKNAFSIFYTWVSAKFANKIRRELALKIFDAYIKQGYRYFADNNSSEILTGIGVDPQSVQTIISNFFTLMVRVITVIAMLCFIIVETPYMAIALFALALVSFGISELIFSKRMKKAGERQRHYSYLARQASIEAIQGSKEIFAMNRQKHFVTEYRRCMEQYDRSSADASVGAAAPSNILETVCVIGIVFSVAFQAINTSDISTMITQIATVALAAFRMLPYLGTIMGCVNTIVFSSLGLVKAYDTLYKVDHMVDKSVLAEVDDHGDYTGRKYVFKKEIELKNIDFSYSDHGKKVLDGLDLKIEKGTSIGLIGTSGAGKTTLADIILALYKPQGGTISMDGVDINIIGGQWHNITGYIPQTAYLSDASVRNNVAFGIPEKEIDDGKVWRALEMAQLKDFVQNLENGLDTKVGEWGVKFSGGQRQRIAIARALYNDPDVLIMDEATAALDNDTEKAVMESIEMLQGIKTLIIVAHRLTTVKKCDQIYEIVDGKAIQRTKNEVFGDMQ